jgi:V8-like Glu-specific endopeptidase
VCTAGPATAAGVGTEAGGASAGAAACTTVQTLAYSQSQAAAAKEYWTPSRIKAAKGFSESALGGLKASQASSTAATPSSAEKCLPDSAVTGALALHATRGVGSPASSSPALSAAAVTASDGYPTIGKLTYKADDVLGLSCTASVINGTSATNNEELILTAAHCIEGTTDGIPYTSTDLAFSPMWNNGNTPYGTWTSEKVFLNSGWMHCSITGCSTNPADDYAVIVLNTQNGEGVGTVTGADGWNSSEPASLSNVTIAGIPSSATDTLTTVVSATTVTESSVSYRTAATPGYTDGTSGGPWLTGFSTSTGLGTLIGDTGGYEQGGPSSGTPSYSNVWDSAFATVVADAVAYED